MKQKSKTIINNIGFRNKILNRNAERSMSLNPTSKEKFMASRKNQIRPARANNADKTYDSNRRQEYSYNQNTNELSSKNRILVRGTSDEDKDYSLEAMNMRLESPPMRERFQMARKV